MNTATHLVTMTLKIYYLRIARIGSSFFMIRGSSLNFFLGRWEAPLPTSPICNAACLGCISLQSEDVPSASQDRITFVPTAEEVAGGVAVPHFNRAQRPVVSFGQGCEGEPLLQAKLLERSVTKIREKTKGGLLMLVAFLCAFFPGTSERSQVPSIEKAI